MDDPSTLNVIGVVTGIICVDSVRQDAQHDRQIATQRLQIAAAHLDLAVYLLDVASPDALMVAAAIFKLVERAYNADFRGPEVVCVTRLQTMNLLPLSCSSFVDKVAVIRILQNHGLDVLDFNAEANSVFRPLLNRSPGEWILSVEWLRICSGKPVEEENLAYYNRHGWTFYPAEGRIAWLEDPQ